MNTVLLLIGSNLGDRQANLKNAAKEIEKELGKIVQSSSVYETAPWGNVHQQYFLNQAIRLLSDLPAGLIMKKIIAIEEKLGRVRKIKWEARIVDIDILFFNDEIISSENLVVPHPGLHERKFVLVPLAELIPGFIHPVLKASVADLLNNVKDTLEVNKLVIYTA